MQTSFEQQFVHIMEKIIGVLHCRLEVGKAELVRQHRLLVESGFVYGFAEKGHGRETSFLLLSVSAESVGVLQGLRLESEFPA